jgi:hypothetical protein
VFTDASASEADEEDAEEGTPAEDLTTPSGGSVSANVLSMCIEGKKKRPFS